MDSESVKLALEALKDCLGVLPIAGVVVGALGYVAVSALQAGENAKLEQEIAREAETVKVKLEGLRNIGANQVSRDAFLEESAVQLLGILCARRARKRWHDRVLACACAQCDKATLDQQLFKLRDILNRIRGEVEEILVARIPHFGDVSPTVPVHGSIDHRRQEVMSFLNSGGGDSALLRVVGIYGVGGLGKTTVMQAVEAEIRNLRTHRIAYVTVGEGLSDRSLCSLQSDIVYHLTGNKEEYPSSQHGITGLTECMESLKKVEPGKKKVACCIFIDNVWTVTDVEKLLPRKLGSVMPPSSYLLVSSRRKDVVDKLNKLCLDPRELQKKMHEFFPYTPGTLQLKEAESVFVQYSSAGGYALLPEHQEVVDTIVPLCYGLPLLLKVYGSHFDSAERIENDWEDVKLRLEAAKDMEGAEERVFEMLKASISCLRPEAVHDAFVDVALFYSKEFTEDYIKHMLDEDSYLSKLVDRSLVSLSLIRTRDGSPRRVEVMVHDLLKAVAKQMQDKVRFHRVQNGWDALAESMPQLRYLEVSGLRSIEDLPCTENLFRELRTLSLRMDVEGAVALSTVDTNYTNFDVEGPVALPPWITHSRNLRCLYLRNIPWESLATRQLPQQLRCLRIVFDPSVNQEMQPFCANVQSMNREMQPFCANVQSMTKLRTLELHNCMHKRIPKWIEHFKRLTRLSITTTDIGGLEEVGKSTGALTTDALTKLKEIDFSGNSQLQLFQGLAPSLEKLDLRGCKALRELPDDMLEATSLREIYLSGCDSLTEVPSSLVRLPALEVLDLGACKALTKLPDDFSQATSLAEIHLRGCDSLTELPFSLALLPALEVLDLGGCKALTKLPDDLSQATSLRKLDLRGCTTLICNDLGLSQFIRDGLICGDPRRLNLR